MSDNEELPRVRKLSQPVDVPVYNCPVFVSGPGEDGSFVGRSATLADVIVRGTSEREVLQSIVAGWSAKGDDRSPGPGEIAVLKISAVTSGRYLPGSG